MGSRKVVRGLHGHSKMAAKNQIAKMGLGQVQALSMTKLLWARCRRVLSIDKWISGEVHGLLSTTKLVWARCMQVLSIDKMGLGQVLGGFVNDKTAWGEVCEGFVN